MDNVIKLAQYLQSETLTAEEREAGMSLASAIFGTGAGRTLESVKYGLLNKKVVTPETTSDDTTDSEDDDTTDGVTDTTETTTDGGDDATETTTEDGDSTEDSEPADSFTVVIDGEPSTFSATTTKSGGKQFRQDGKIISKADYEAAYKEAAGEA